MRPLPWMILPDMPAAQWVHALQVAIGLVEYLSGHMHVANAHARRALSCLQSILFASALPSRNALLCTPHVLGLAELCVPETPKNPIT